MILGSGAQLVLWLVLGLHCGFDRWPQGLLNVQHITQLCQGLKFWHHRTHRNCMEVVGMLEFSPAMELSTGALTGAGLARFLRTMPVHHHKPPAHCSFSFWAEYWCTTRRFFFRTRGMLGFSVGSDLCTGLQLELSLVLD